MLERLQLLNTNHFIFLTEWGIIIFFNEVQFENALAYTTVTESGTITFLIFYYREKRPVQFRLYI